MKFSPYPKQEPKAKRPRIPLHKYPRKGATGELKLFKEIINERGCRSQVSGKYITEITVSSMAHILSKKMYPKFRLYKKNIVVMTPEEHYQFDFTSHEKLKMLPEWKWIFDLKEELLNEYKLKTL